MFRLDTTIFRARFWMQTTFNPATCRAKRTAIGSKVVFNWQGAISRLEGIIFLVWKKLAAGWQALPMQRASSGCSTRSNGKNINCDPNTASAKALELDYGWAWE